MAPLRQNLPVRTASPINMVACVSQWSRRAPPSAKHKGPETQIPETNADDRLHPLSPSPPLVAKSRRAKWAGKTNKYLTTMTAKPRWGPIPAIISHTGLRDNAGRRKRAFEVDTETGWSTYTIGPQMDRSPPHKAPQLALGARSYKRPPGWAHAIARTSPA